MRILITGAGGMLASDLRPVLATKHEVLALDRASCDITDEAAVERAVGESRPDLIVNCAAFPDVDGCERDPERAFAVNGRGPGILARAAEGVGARLIHISTDYVFDGRKRTPYREDDPTNTINIYGESKLQGERRVLEDGAGACHLILRTSWLFGIGKANFIEGTLSEAQSKDRLAVVADQVSCPTWTLHLAQKIAALLEIEACGILHLAGSGECSRHELASYIVRKLPRPVPVEPITWAELQRPAKRPAYSVMVSQRLEELRLAPLPHWQAAVDEYLRVRETAAVGAKAP
jgi:dTDP-4-dehydrorhamnose reductase